MLKQMEITNNTNNNTILLLKEIKERALKEKEHRSILEVLNPVSLSFSRYLEGYETYILNNLVNKEELEQYGILGAIGNLSESGMVFSEREEKNIKRPSIKDFDLIIGNGISITSFNAKAFPQEKVFGFCTEENDPSLRLRINRAESLVHAYNNSFYPGYEMLNYHKNGKVYCIVKKV